MLDPKVIVDDPEAVKANLGKRFAGEDVLCAIDEVAQLNNQRGALIRERDGLLNERNVLSKQIGQMYREGKGEEAAALKEKVSSATQRAKAIDDEELEAVEARHRDLLLSIPNTLRDEVPAGRNEDDNVEQYTWGEVPTFDFTPQAHVEIGEKLGILDFEGAVRLSGARFWVLRGMAARMERALINFFLDLHTGEHGYQEIMTPYIVHRSAMIGTGQLPKFEEDMFKLAQPLNGQDAYLIPTAEVPVTNLHADTITEEAALPLKYACFTPCFRAEAGTHGKEVRGLIRVHQFHKVELVWITTPEHSPQAHEELLSHAEKPLQLLGLPYRVELLCGGDTGFSATKCFDLEVWMPSQGKYREVSSVSSFGDFQARRMSARYRPSPVDGKKGKPRLAHTLNGSGLAVGRTMVAILENYQQADGSVIVPEKLRPYMGGIEAIRLDEAEPGA